MAKMRSVCAGSPDDAASTAMRSSRIFSRPRPLESDFGAELELAGRQLAVHLAVVRRVDDTPQLGEVGCIQQVERLGTDFDADVFADAEAFAERSIDVKDAWTDHGVPAEE